MAKTSETVRKPMTKGQIADLTHTLAAAIPDTFSSDEAQRLIGKKGEVITAVRAVLMNLAREIPAALAAWEAFYRKEFGLTLDLSSLVIPPKQEGFDRLVVVAEGLTPNRVFDACRKHFKCWRYTDNLDAITSDLTPSGIYAVWFRDRIEADEEMKNKSANDLADEKTTGITLIERLLLELVYFKETGKHLDVVNVTLCDGSRDPDGYVPYVYWDSYGRMSVDWYGPDSRNGGLRARVAVR